MKNVAYRRLSGFEDNDLLELNSILIGLETAINENATSPITATNLYAVTVTATNLSGTTLSGTSFSGSTATSAGGTDLCFSRGGSATLDAQVISGNKFLRVMYEGSYLYIPAFTTLACSSAT